MKMDLKEACIYRLAEKEVISQNAAKVMRAIFRKPGMNKFEIAAKCGLAVYATETALEELSQHDAVELYLWKYFCTRKEETLVRLIEMAEMHEKIACVAVSATG